MTTETKTTFVYHQVVNNFGQNMTCPTFYKYGECDSPIDTHRFIKTIYCGREWCPECGQAYSVAHKKRMVGFFNKVTKIQNYMYIVFTIPKHLRWKYKTREALNDWINAICGHKGKHIEGILPAFGFDRGIARIHYFGDKSTDYHPHLNVVIDTPRIPLEILEGIKELYSSEIGYSGKAVVEFTPKPTIGQIFHNVEYITRPTFTDYYREPELARALFHFRNIRYFGDWKGLPNIWSWETTDHDLEKLAIFEKGECPVCKTMGVSSKVRWYSSLPYYLREMENNPWRFIQVTKGYDLMLD